MKTKGIFESSNGGLLIFFRNIIVFVGGSVVSYERTLFSKGSKDVPKKSVRGKSRRARVSVR
jgi:hypothetical protein